MKTTNAATRALSRRTLLATAAALCLLLGAARPARALEMGLEIEVGTSIPLATFPDGVPVPFSDPSGSSILGIPDSAYNLLLDAKPTTGFSTAISLLLGKWYLRSAFSFNTISSARFTHYAVRRVGGVDLPEAVHNIYVGQLDEQFDLDETTTVLTFRLGFGRRWYLLDEGLFRPYLMMGAGGLLALVEGEANGGLTFHVGGGVDIYLGLGVDLGLKAYYEWMGVILPSDFQASSAAKAASATVTAGTSVFEAFLESLHTLQVTASVTYRF